MAHIDYLHDYRDSIVSLKKHIMDSIKVEFQAVYPETLDTIGVITKICVDGIIYHIDKDSLISDYKYETRIANIVKSQNIGTDTLFDVITSIKNIIINYFNTDNADILLEINKLFDEIISVSLMLLKDEQKLQQFSNNEKSTKQKPAEQSAIEQKDAKLFDAKTADLIINKNRLAQIGDIFDTLYYQWTVPISKINDEVTQISNKVKYKKATNKNLTDFLSFLSKETSSMAEAIELFKTLFAKNEQSISTNLEHTIEYAIKLIRPSLDRNSIELVTDFVYEDDIVTFENELILVILNLLKNSEEVLVENNIENPIVVIIGYQDEEYQYIEVFDNGGGVEEDELEKIFEEYYTTKDSLGLGLGLYTSKMIVEDQLMGELRAQNVDEGIKFTISLPLLYKR